MGFILLKARDYNPIFRDFVPWLILWFRHLGFHNPFGHRCP